MTATTTENGAVPGENGDGDVCIIDADAHVTEPPDLWSSRVPATFANRVPVHVDPHVRRRVLQDNACELYGIKLPSDASRATPGGRR